MKNFAKNILSILNSIKAKEESEQKQEELAAQRSPIRDVRERNREREKSHFCLSFDQRTNVSSPSLSL
jgi:hypothetical protein